MAANKLLTGADIFMAPSTRKKKSTSGRLFLRPSNEVIGYLERLAKIGIHGKNPTDVATNLIGHEIERLIKERILELKRD